ncbi:hypothetical protein BW685_07435 [Burkholderia ubonensis]|uniref:Uncharacterized protein n=1 Tax=Burkholderia ubonensis TaxID=101571 RepID=A0A1R1JEQ1_9BURK|nr:hypothetical protein BW685_07435 [Burkholderia ubonensis]
MSLLIIPLQAVFQIFIAETLCRGDDVFPQARRKRCWILQMTLFLIWLLRNQMSIIQGVGMT